MKFLSAILLLLTGLISRPQTIITVAGNGTYGNSGNGGPATAAQLAWPVDITSDNAGNIYIADQDNNVIRKVDAAGSISIFCGNGISGYSGDGGQALNAQLYHPGKMCFDAFGNLFFTDQNGDLIRKIDKNGIISSFTTYNPIAGYSGDNGPVSAARFSSIAGISFDPSGNMFIADYGNHVIRKVNTVGIISTVVGNGTSGAGGDGGPASAAQLNAPYGVAFDKSGNMYIPDNENHHIRKVSPSGIITTFCGTGAQGYSGDGGPAIQAKLKHPWSIAIDQADDLFIADAGNKVVRKVGQDGIISTFAGNSIYGNSGDGGSPGAASLGIISALHVDQYNNLFIAIRESFNVIKKVTNYQSAFPIITITSPSTAICPGTILEFTASTINEGEAPVYKWMKNGLIAGNNAPSYSDSTFQHGDVVTCQLTSKNSCLIQQTVTSNIILITVYQSPTVELKTVATLCTGSSLTLDPGPFANYQWSTGSTDQLLYVTKPGLYLVYVTDTNGCIARGQVQVTAKDCITAFFMPTAFSPNKDGRNDFLKPILPENINGFEFNVYNRFGQLVFKSNNPMQGWDGNMHGTRQAESIYIWTCSYSADGKPVQHQKGTVIVTR